jgi:hypothetical protein
MEQNTLSVQEFRDQTTMTQKWLVHSSEIDMWNRDPKVIVEEIVMDDGVRNMHLYIYKYEWQGVCNIIVK